MYFILVFFYKSTRYSLFMPLQYRYPIYFSAAASKWAGWALAHPEFGSSINPITTRGQIMSTTLLLAHLALKTQRHLCKVYPTRYQYPLTNYLGQKGVNHIRTIPIANSTVTWLPSGYFLKK